MGNSADLHMLAVIMSPHTQLFKNDAAAFVPEGNVLLQDSRACLEKVESHRHELRNICQGGVTYLRFKTHARFLALGIVGGGNSRSKKCYRQKQYIQKAEAKMCRGICSKVLLQR